jgi:hypothetical protein
MSEGNNDAAGDQRPPDDRDEPEVLEIDDGVATISLKDHLSDHLTDDQLTMVISSIQDALTGLIEAPYDEYKALNSALEQGLTLTETLLETNKSEMADEALELVNKEKMVAPPILRGVIQQELNPVRERVKKIEQHRATTVVLSPAQRRKLLKSAKKKRKKKQVDFEGIPGGNGEDYGNDKDDADAANSRPKKKPKNSNSHPAPAAAVTQKKEQNTSQNGNQRRRRKRDKKSNGQNEVHSQQPEKGSNVQQNGRRGNRNNRKKQSKGK